MSPLLRGSLIAVSVTGAFAAGFFLKPRLAPVDAGQTPMALAQTAPKGVPVSAWSKGGPPVVPQQHVDSQVPEVLPPLAPPPLPPPDFSDPGQRMVKDALNIKTTILDKTEPLLPVLAPPAAPVLLVEAPLLPTPRSNPKRVDAPKIDVPPIPVKLVNARDIALDFEITKTGIAKVSSVELWTTRDGGQTWARTDQMAGCQSPFRTRLGSEGMYGFRLVFVSESGMRLPEPTSSDKPNLSVELDTTPPKVELLPPRSLPDQPGKVRIGWKMTDRHMTQPEIRLQYSTDGRTWLQMDAIVRGGLDFADWTMPAGLPHQVMIRLTARDDAGNEAIAQSPERVTIDLVAPQGKLTRIRSTGGQEVGPKPREVAGTPITPTDANKAIFSFWVGVFAE